MEKDRMNEQETNSGEEKGYFFTRNRFIFIAVLLLFIFLVFMAVIWIKSDAIFHDPCGICSKRMGEKVVCTTGGEYGKIITRTYFPNFTIADGVS